MLLLLFLEILGVNQVHLSIPENDIKSMIVTYSTPFVLEKVYVRYGLDLNLAKDHDSVRGWSRKFVDNGTLHHTQYIHRVTLTHLKPAQKYYYQIWNVTDWSETIFSFISQSPSYVYPSFTVYGDFGLSNPRSMKSLLYEKDQVEFEKNIHIFIGDYAYDMFRDNATWGDNWFNFMQPLFSQVPVMTCIGNHEGMYDALNYRSRFTMPRWEELEAEEESNLYFSFNSGTTHWISYDTEFYFVYEAMEDHGGVHRNFGPYPEKAKRQLEWMEQDLIRANKERHLRPWIFSFGHRPFYCSDSDDDDCVNMNNHWKADLERLFFKYGVDIVFEAHQHTYERLWPVNNGVVMNGTRSANPYDNPSAPIHIVTGAAGCQENLDLFDKGSLGEWSAVRISDYGYGHLNIINETHLYWEQIQGETRTLQDSIMLVRDEHHSFEFIESFMGLDIELDFE